MCVTNLSELFSLRGTVALVAGGAGAIGSALAEGLAAYGASVAVGDYNAQGAADVAGELGRSTGARTMGVRLDANDPT